MYIPPDALCLEHATYAQIRMGIQGPPGDGKTWAALTFPNPVVANIDRGLGAHIGRKDVLELPFYDKTFNKKYSPSDPTDVKVGLLEWVKTEGMKLTEEQTFIGDALTGMESAYHTHWSRNKSYSKSSGQVNEREEWTLKLEYFGELCDLFLQMRCNVILITHEQDARSKSGDYTGKLKPLMSGQFADKIVSKFTDWFRAMTCSKPDLSKLQPSDIAKIKEVWGMNLNEFTSMCNSFPRQTIYYWQTCSDDIFSGKCSSLVDYPSRIPANYESFKRYMRKPISVLPKVA